MVLRIQWAEYVTVLRTLLTPSGNDWVKSDTIIAVVTDLPHSWRRLKAPLLQRAFPAGLSPGLSLSAQVVWHPVTYCRTVCLSVWFLGVVE